MFVYCQNRKLKISSERKLKCTRPVYDCTNMFYPVAWTEYWKSVLFKANYHMYILKYTHMSHHSIIVIAVYMRKGLFVNIH